MSVSVCMSVCPHGYLRKHITDLHEFFCMLPVVAVARSSSGGVAIRYVYTSDFVDDVTFADNGPYSGMPLALQQLAAT